MNGIRYIPHLGEVVCMNCGEVLLELAPVVCGPLEPMKKLVQRAMAVEAVDREHFAKGCKDAFEQPGASA